MYAFVQAVFNKEVFNLPFTAILYSFHCILAAVFKFVIFNIHNFSYLFLFLYRLLTELLGGRRLLLL